MLSEGCSQPPHTPEPPVPAFAYQGVLKDSSQSAIKGSKSVTFRLYNSASGGTVLWARKFNVLLDNNGLFNIEVSDANGSSVDEGRHTNLRNALLDSTTTTYFLGLTVEGSEEIRPRQPVQGELSVGGFSVSGANGESVLTICLDGIEAGETAAADRLSDVFLIEGAYTADGVYDSANVSVVFGAPVDGMPVVTVNPANAAATAFFVKVSLK